jgi:glutathione S-transferase
VTAPQLTYFEIRGRAEPIRLLLEEAGVVYDDVQISQDEWPKRKPSMPFGQVPMYREGDLELVQSHAILRHLARKHGLDGRDERQRVRCDIAIEAFRDIGDRMGAVFGALGSNRADHQKAFVEDELPERLAALERFYDSNPAGPPFWVGEALTVADILAFNFIEGFEAAFPDSLRSTPHLREFSQQFAGRPRIQAYFQSDRRPAALMYGPSGKIYPRA